jgi:putative heme-binding domain-containing protein
MRKEILESILFPSHVISDQYAAKTIITSDGKSYTGIVAPGATETAVLLRTGEKIIVANDDIEAKSPSRISAMPDGLLNDLSLTEISDLFAYLGVLPPPSVAEREIKVRR